MSTARSDGEVTQNNEQDQDEEDNFISAAHFDILAEIILLAFPSKPGWVTSLGSEDQKIVFAKDHLAEATTFVDYDKIDMVHQEEEESQQIMMIENDGSAAGEDGGGTDTLNNQGSIKSKDTFELQMKILKTLETFFEQQMCSETYEPMQNNFRLIIQNLKQ